MSADFWNARYATDAYIFGTAPNVFLASQAGLIRPGMRALAIADGEGRNGVWLAEQGAAVHAIDVSPLALDKVDNTTVYTFLYPIEGLHPKAIQMSKQIWCAPNRNKAWDDYITRGTVPNNDGKCANPVDATIALGQKLKVSGTPTLFFVNGQRVPGMVPAAQLEKLFAANEK
jgi:hypothetical protein